MTITTACPQGITSEQLAALRDGALPAAEAARLRTHLAACLTCQGTQAAYEEVARILATQRIPTPDARLWHGVQARLRQPNARALPIVSRALWGGAGALASVVVLVVLFAQVFGHLSGTSTSFHSTMPQSTQTASITPAPTITPTALPALHVQWQPQNFGPANAISPADGDVAYGCVLNANGTAIAIWRGQRGQSPQNVATLSGPGADNGSCTIVPDDNQANIVVVRIFGSNGHGPQAAAPFSAHAAPGTGPELQDDVSYDSGISWRIVPNGIEISELATVGNLTYATIGTAQVPNPVLAVSHDGMTTWHKLHAPSDTPYAYVAPMVASMRVAHQPLASSADFGSQIWASSFDSTIYYLNNVYQIGFVGYVSHNGGISWKAVALPSSDIGQIVEQPPTSAQPWHICARDLMTFAIWCSLDGGQTWQKQPAPPGAPQSFFLGGIAADGDLVGGSETPNSSQDAAIAYRLAPGAPQWQSLGAAPSAPNLYPAPGGANVMWAEAINNPAFPQFLYAATYP
jgi:hypothetical protein